MIESLCALTGGPAALAARGLHPDRDLGHGLVWTLFDDVPPGTPRDFLYRVECQRPFRVIVRSLRPPRPGNLWTVKRSYPFRPVLWAGQVLSFRVTCVPATWTRTTARHATRPQDVVTAAWRGLPPEASADPEQLAAAADAAALGWLERQGATRGFMPMPEVEVLAYERHRLRRGPGGVVFGAMTFEGLLRVTDPEAFRRVLAGGLGRQRAFGMGLVQIARPRGA